MIPWLNFHWECQLLGANFESGKGILRSCGCPAKVNWTQGCVQIASLNRWNWVWLKQVQRSVWGILKRPTNRTQRLINDRGQRLLNFSLYGSSADHIRNETANPTKGEKVVYTARLVINFIYLLISNSLSWVTPCTSIQPKTNEGSHWAVPDYLFCGAKIDSVGKFWLMGGLRV